MVSFSCETCGDVLTKKKLDPHRNRCRGATFTCIDCMVHFPGVQYRSHTSCMTEDQKYQGALYKEKPKKQNQNHNQNQMQNPYQYQNNNNNNAMAYHHAYVEDYGEDQYEWNEHGGRTEGNSPSDPLPEAPTPPSAAVEDDHVDVFDFLVATGQTPNASHVDLNEHSKAQPVPEPIQSTSLVRYEPKEDDDEFIDANAYMDNDALVEYDQVLEPAPQFVTPLPKSERRKSRGSDAKKDKKRKRLHVDIPTDQEMTDAPPVLHTGLTGGLNRMMQPVFPPSPDYSGADVPEISPASPLKKSKHSKHSKHAKQGNSLFSIIAASSKSKTKPKKRKTTKTSSSKTSTSKSSSKSSSKKHSSKDKDPKLIEYGSKEAKPEAAEGQVILFKPRVDMFLSIVDKGPESERGYSMNKVLKRFHRERQAAGTEMGKGSEEKELWKSLRLRQNERGEIVLFSI